MSMISLGRKENSTCTLVSFHPKVGLLVHDPVLVCCSCALHAYLLFG